MLHVYVVWCLLRWYTIHCGHSIVCIICVCVCLIHIAVVRRAPLFVLLCVVCVMLHINLITSWMLSYRVVTQVIFVSYVLCCHDVHTLSIYGGLLM